MKTITTKIFSTVSKLTILTKKSGIEQILAKATKRKTNLFIARTIKQLIIGLEEILLKISRLTLPVISRVNRYGRISKISKGKVEKVLLICKHRSKKSNRKSKRKNQRKILVEINDQYYLNLNISKCFKYSTDYLNL